jgi:methylated-DNA-[protein]-cysteine S-methyltransferase
MNLYLDTFKDKKFGIFNIGVTDKGLRLVTFGKYPGLSEILEHACNHELSIAKNPQKTRDIKAQLKEYLQGKRMAFKVKLDVDYLPPFKRRALKEASKIPFGKVITYGQLARKAGSPKAARAAGQAMATNPISIIIPCHRVIGSNGGLTGFGGGIKLKKRLLMMEGVAIAGERVVVK